MHRTQYLRLWLETFLYASAAFAQQELVGCIELGCPTAPGDSTSIECRVGNTMLDLVGVATNAVSIPEGYNTPGGNEASLAWTIGIRGASFFDYAPNNDTLRVINRIFYLGAHPDLDLTADDLPYQGCAFFFSDKDNHTVGYDERFLRGQGGEAECGDLIGNECTSSLLSAARNSSQQQDDSLDAWESCSNIAAALQSSIPASCEGLTPADTIITARPLTDESAPQPLMGAANSSSTCHPTLPKSNVLSQIFNYNLTLPIGGDNNTAVTNVFGYTPILTLFFLGEGSDEVQDSAAQMTCLRPVVLTSETLSTRNQGEGVRRRSNWTFMGVAGLAVGLWAWSLM